MAGVNHEFESTALWRRTLLARQDDAEEPQREKLRQAFLAFRERVALLISHIKTELPDLTLHDITHVDALWRVASEVIGDDYPINPAEAFVLGGAFLLHDAAHCRAAFFKGGLEEIRQTPQWQDAAALAGCDGNTVSEADPAFRRILFETLRVLHPFKAEDLPFAEWGDKSSMTQRLLPNDELRDAYGHVIGQVARSHWQSPHELEAFAKRSITSPTCLLPSSWEVNPLKLALILRTADALHMDATRAPRFLMQMSPPQNRVSAQHWQFQSKLHAVKGDAQRQEIKITGSPFKADQQQAWWLAYDMARMADRELEAAHQLLRDNGMPVFAVREVAGVRSPDAFANHVPANGWHPVDTEVRISQVHQLVENFGGAKLYGDEPHWALRELLQNALDAVHAWRKLAGVQGLEGEIEVALEPVTEDQSWVHVTDTGIGMSRYVLTNVLLDFGRSLWRSADLSAEWQGLAASKFEAIGQFGMGFFSVFMLGQHVKVTTRRYESKAGEAEQQVLEFTNGARQRATLRSPTREEKLNRHGTRVSVLVTEDKLSRLRLLSHDSLGPLIGWLAPAVDVTIYCRDHPSLNRKEIVRANDWLELTTARLMERIYGSRIYYPLTKILDCSRSIKGYIARVGGLYVTEAYGLQQDHCVGIVHGLRAGEVVGLSGILSCRAQSELNRKDAVPDLVWEDLSNWAQAHKNDLMKRGQLDSLNSAMLAKFGASPDGLVLGVMKSGNVGQAELSSFLRGADKLIIHVGQIDFDLNESIPKDQQDFFHPDDSLLCVERYFLPSWVSLIPGCSHESVIKDDIWRIVSDVWNGEVTWVEEDALVGECDGEEIWRCCMVAVRCVVTSEAGETA